MKFVLRNPGVTDESAFDFLISQSISEEIAIDIIGFVPIAFTRLYFTQIKFPDTYLVRYPEGKADYVRHFMDNDVYAASVVFYQNHKKILTEEDVLNIAGRSSEFDALSQAIKAGSDLRNILINPTIFLY